MVKNHKADSFDAGRAASVTPDADPVKPPELSRKALPGSNVGPEDDDIRALLLAVLALAGADD